MREVKTQKQIIKDLGLVEHICQTPILTSVQKAQLELKVQRVLQWIDDHHKSVDCDVALQLLDFLRSLNASKDFQELFGSHYATYLIHINAAFFVQQSWRETPSASENHTQIKEAIKVLKKAESTVVSLDQTSLLLKTKINFCTVRHYLHLAASFSQFSLHKKALKAAQKCLNCVDSLLQGLQPLLPSKKTSSAVQLELLNFIEHQQKTISLLDEALRSFETSDANHSAGESLNQPDRAIGEKLDAEWLQHISIASFMHVEFVSWEKAHQPISSDELLQTDFFALLAMTVAALMFVIATENRFVCLESFSLSAFKIRPVFEKTHQQRLRKVKRFLFSERVHAYALRMLQNYFRPNALSSHLSVSFQKNYYSQHRLEDIPEVDEGSFATPRNGIFASINDSGVEYSFDNAKTRVFGRESAGRRESFGSGSLGGMGRLLGSKTAGNIYIFENLHNKNNIYMNCADRRCRADKKSRKEKIPSQPNTERLVDCSNVPFLSDPLSQQLSSHLLTSRRSTSSADVEKLLVRLKEKKPSSPPKVQTKDITSDLLKMMKAKLPFKNQHRTKETPVEVKKLISSLQTKKCLSAKNVVVTSTNIINEVKDLGEKSLQEVLNGHKAAPSKLDNKKIPPLNLKGLGNFSSLTSRMKKSTSGIFLNSNKPFPESIRNFCQTSRSSSGIQRLLKQIKSHHT